MAASEEQLKRWLEELDDYTLEQKEIQQKAMAAAIVHALKVTEDNGDMEETIRHMLFLDETLVSKLEFIISSLYIEEGLHQIEGGRYAH